MSAEPTRASRISVNVLDYHEANAKYNHFMWKASNADAKRKRALDNLQWLKAEAELANLGLCPRCGKPKTPDSIGHRHTGHLCFHCGYSTDRDAA